MQTIAALYIGKRTLEPGTEESERVSARRRDISAFIGELQDPYIGPATFGVNICVVFWASLKNKRGTGCLGDSWRKVANERVVQGKT
jgi:hypothetical protein